MCIKLVRLGDTDKVTNAIDEIKLQKTIANLKVDIHCTIFCSS